MDTRDVIAYVPASLASKVRHPFVFKNWKPWNLHRSDRTVHCNISFKIDSTSARKRLHVLNAKIGDKYALNNKMMHFLARTCFDSICCDVFAIRHAQNELTTEPVGARWLEKVMWNWRVQILSEWRDNSIYWSSSTVHLNLTSNTFFVLQVLLLDKNIDVRILRAREIDLRLRKIRQN